MNQSPELLARIASWRAKQAAGTMTIEDWKEAMTDLRQHRTSAQSAAAASRAKRAPVDTSALKDGLRALARKA